MRGRTMLCFFFQAEDGIRDWSVTGVQTCALPILGLSAGFSLRRQSHGHPRSKSTISPGRYAMSQQRLNPFNRPRRNKRSEERRVGKESRTQYMAYPEKSAREAGDSRRDLVCERDS